MNRHPSPHIFCLIPRERAGDLLAPLRRHYERDPSVEVLVERRIEEVKPRFIPAAEQPHGRAPVARRDLRRSLPARLPDAAAAVRFEQRMAPLGGLHQATPTEHLLTAIRAGDADAASELWWRVHERVRMRLRARLGDVESPRAERHVLGRILDALEDYEPDADRRFTAWLDDVVDRYAAEQHAV